MDPFFEPISDTSRTYPNKSKTYSDWSYNLFGHVQNLFRLVIQPMRTRPKPIQTGHITYSDTSRTYRLVIQPMRTRPEPIFIIFFIILVL